MKELLENTNDSAIKLYTYHSMFIHDAPLVKWPEQNFCPN